MAVWQAKQACPRLVIVLPDYRLYLHFSKMLRKIYENYSDRVECFGLDECWIDLTNRDFSMKDGWNSVHEIRKLGITVSVGLSYNKSFSKLDSDLKKPDAVTMISPADFMQLPACDLLYVGPKTT